MDRMFTDPYQILGVSVDASRKQIKRRYRSLVRRFHPDLNPDDPGAEEQFKRVQWAYETLRTEKGHGKRGTVVHYTPGAAGVFGRPSHPFFWFSPFMRAYWERMRREVAEQSERKTDRTSES